MIVLNFLDCFCFCPLVGMLKRKFLIKPMVQSTRQDAGYSSTGDFFELNFLVNAESENFIWNSTRKKVRRLMVACSKQKTIRKG